MGNRKAHHFAHAADSTCWLRESDEPNMALHISYQWALAAWFMGKGIKPVLEEVHYAAHRRVDIACTNEDGSRFAVEVQNSPISIEEVQRRNAIDRQLGFSDTWWVFTAERVQEVMLSQDRWGEVRLPAEMRLLSDRLFSFFGGAWHKATVSDASERDNDPEGRYGGVGYVPKTIKLVSWTRLAL